MEPMARPTKYSPELRERAVRMVQEHAAEYPSQWATIRSVGEKLGCSVEAFGFPVRDLTAETIVDRRRMLQMGVPPVQIPVMSAISGVEWEEAWSDRVEGPLGRHTVHFLDRAAFLRNKAGCRPAQRPRRY
jgi:transposase-like protein